MVYVSRLTLVSLNTGFGVAYNYLGVIWKSRDDGVPRDTGLDDAKYEIRKLQGMWE